MTLKNSVEAVKKLTKKKKEPQAEILQPVITGLSSAEVEERVQDGRVNGDQDIKTKTIPQIISSNALTFFNIIFITLAIILAFFVEKSVQGFANFGFLFIVVINFTAGVIQEVNAKKTIDKLSLLSAPKVIVLRDGAETEIRIKDIVLDDIILLQAGNQITADSVIVDGSIEVNESLITGEPDPVLKNTGDEILSGSFVVSGNATTKVIRIGRDNYAAKISNGAKYIKPVNSVILRSVKKFIKIMGITIIPLGLALFLVKYHLQDGDLNKTVLTVIGTVIGMIPSGLMLLTTAVFCLSVIRLSGYKALAQDLYCTENLARVNVLCLDKTGTITEGKMEVTGLVPNNLLEDDMLFVLKNMTSAIQDHNPTADAIREYTKDVSVTDEALSVIPFSSKRKWSAAEFKSGTYVMGAAEFVISKMTKKMQNVLNYHAEKGNRVLVLARCTKIRNNELPKTVDMVGFIILTDRIRKEAAETLAYFENQGVEIKIISGDSPLTVKSIAKRAGVKDFDNYVDAQTLTDEEKIKEAALKYTIFGRVTPDQKLALIKALKAAGKTVAMTGDGVNDVLALKEADCSVAMASGSDAAKTVSQLVLLDSNFASMPKIVEEGRRSINNLERTSSLFLVKTIYNVIFAFIFMILQSELPFEPKHFTLLGLVTIGIPSNILALERNHDRVTGRFFSKVLTNALPGSLTTVISVVAIVLASRIYPDITHPQVSTMCLIVTATVGFAYLAKICYPLNLLRTILLVSVVLIFAGAFFAKFEAFDFPAFYGLSTDISVNMLIIMAPIAVLSIPLFVGIYFLLKVLDRWRLIDRSLEKLKI